MTDADLIKQFEGLRLTAYQDLGGVWTVGYGHTGPDVHEGMEISNEEAETLLQADLLKFREGVATLCPVSTPGQHGACVSLAYNIGLERFRTSSVCRLHNLGKYAEAGQAFALWNKCAGKVEPGLVRRRAAEAALYLSDLPAEQTASVDGEDSLTKSRTISGGAIAATATGVSAVAEASKQVDSWKDTLADLVPYIDSVKWILLVLTLVGIGLTIYARISERKEGRN